MRLLIALLLLCRLCAAEIGLDGAWWAQADRDIRIGVVDGLVDCLTYDRHEVLPALPTEQLEKKVTAYYAQHSEKAPVERVLLLLPKRPKTAPKGGEDHSKEKHGYYDGLFWGQSTRKEQIGFVLGYLSCTSARQKADESAARRLAASVSSWYDKHPKENERKIADVLSELLSTSK